MTLYDPILCRDQKGARLHTNTVHNSLDPKWDEAFYMPVHDQASTLEILLYDDDFVNDQLIGRIEFDLSNSVTFTGSDKQRAKRLKKNMERWRKAGRRLGLAALFGSRGLEEARAHRALLRAGLIIKELPAEPEPEADPEPSEHVEVSGELEWYKVKRVDRHRHKHTKPHGEEAAGNVHENVKHLGEIRVCVRFAPKEQEDYLLKKWAKKDVAVGRIKAKTSNYRVRTLSNERKCGWIKGLNWIKVPDKAQHLP